VAIMSKESEAAASEPSRRSTYWLLQAGLYKRNQGRITRQVTFGAVLFCVAFGGWRLGQEIGGWGLLAAAGPRLARALEIGIPLALVAAGTWFAYRLVNYPRFADFLIAVEAEMAKVSWPTRSELIRSSVVVIVVILGLAIVLFGYDAFWKTLLRLLRVGGG